MSELLGIATSGLLSVQKALGTVSHNINNANTPGFNRQQDVFATRPANRVGDQFIGSGVSVEVTRRMVNDFVTDSFRAQTSQHSELETSSQLFQDLDILLADPTTGIADGLNQFFLSLQEVNNNPSSIPTRQLFISQSQLLESRFQGLNTQVEDRVRSTDQQLGFLTNEVNVLAQSIGELNIKLSSVNGTAGEPNDLLDQRDQLILELSEYVEVLTNEQEDGSVNLLIGNGLSLVTGASVSTIETAPSQTSTSLDVFLTSNASRQNITTNLNGGEIGALINLRDNALTEIQNSLGRLAITLASAFNDQNAAGMDLNGELGGLVFSDVNSLEAMRARSVQSIGNTGDAIFNVSIDSIKSQETPPYQVFSSGANLTDTSALPDYVSGLTRLNNINIRTTVPGDDTVSSAGALGSAISIANAVNASSAQHGVTASAEPNALLLGQFTPGAYAAGEFAINGINIVTTGIDNATLVQDINALSSQTGVVAKADTNNNIVLEAKDGRNIQLTSNANTPAATFSHFDTNSGVALDKIQRANISLISTNTIDIKGNNPSVIGFETGTVPTVSSTLSVNDYFLTYDGANYRLNRASDQALVAQGSTPDFSVDGFTLSLVSGSMQVNDVFKIQPTKNGAKEFITKLSDPNKLALALPVSSDASLSNKGSGSIAVSNVIDVSGVPVSTTHKLGNAFEKAGQLSPPIRIEFVNETTYKVFNIANGNPGIQLGPDQSFDPEAGEQDVFPLASVTDNTAPGPNPPYVYDPGYRVTLKGDMKAGDSFTIGYNQDAASDNRNSNKMIGFQLDKLVNGGNASLQEAFTQIVSRVATQSGQSQVNLKTSTSFLQAIESRRNSISGVNLEEEAANMLKFQQSYQAIAQIFVIARDNFNTLLSTVGG
tara:strand:+ start:79344 stop:82004 length:2661 start_codon:yes stop_codon:yes gene_type:complete